MITNIQALRAFAALAVVFCHTGRYIFGVHTDFEGVAIFFVISGFIIPTITYRNAFDFTKHRLIRLVPIYWLATLAYALWMWFRPDPELEHQTMIVFGLVAMGLIPGAWFSKLVGWHVGTKLVFLALTAYLLWTYGYPYAVARLLKADDRAIEYIYTSLAFLPNPVDPNGFPVNRVGWTLNLEMLFYGVFAVALLFGKRLAPILAAASVLVFKVSVEAGACDDFYCHVYADNYLYFFVLGFGVYYLYEEAKRREDRVPNWAAACMTLAGIAVIFVANVWMQKSSLGDALRYIGPPLLVFGALLCHLKGWRITSRWMVLVGDASYAMYLFHLLVLETFVQFAAMFPWMAPGTLLGAASYTLVCVLVAIGIHQFVEKPLTVSLRWRGKDFRIPGLADFPKISPARYTHKTCADRTELVFGAADSPASEPTTR